MTAPLIPYINIPPLQLVGPTTWTIFGSHVPVDISIKPFGAVVALGVWIGSELAVRHARVMRLDLQKLQSLIFTTLVWGFVAAHVLDAIFYHPADVVRDPLYLLRIWQSLSSFGGFTGAVAGVLYWRWKHKEPILGFCEAIASAFPAAWVFGRTGCSIAHDHPGMRSDAWFAVQYPGGGRFDLGLYEMLLTIPLALAFLWLARRPRPRGFFLGALCMAYAPTRFALDFLRAHDVADADPRYAGLTPAQWGCFLLLAVGVYFSWHAATSAEKPSAEPSAGAPPPADPSAAPGA